MELQDSKNACLNQNSSRFIAMNSVVSRLRNSIVGPIATNVQLVGMAKFAPLGISKGCKCALCSAQASVATGVNATPTNCHAASGFASYTCSPNPGSASLQWNCWAGAGNELKQRLADEKGADASD